VQDFPHIYTVSASGEGAGNLTVTAAGLPALASAAPKEFGGPGDQWSPESLLCASLASCFILTFRAVARASKLNWHALECRVQGTLERVDGVTQFTRFVTTARLTVPPGGSADLCRRLLEKAEHACLIANSLRSQRELQAEIVVIATP
jgi:organic hydroperoxide reductase OsmC/OhrA